MTVHPRLWIGLAAVLAVAATAVAARGLGGRPAGSDLAAAAPPATAVVTRGTLVATERVSGTLGYGTEHVVSAHTPQPGTVTWLPALGGTVARGQPMYNVDNRPVVLLYGDVPPYRTLKSGLTGPDVRQIEANLAALGYGGVKVDARYTSATAAAVERWQADIGQPRTGRVEPSAVVVAPAAVRISGWRVTPGDPAAGPIVSYTGTTRVVSIDLDVDRQTLVQPGLATTITLPDGRSTPGAIVAVGQVATIHSAATRALTGEATGTATIEVTVAVADQAALGALDSAPVEVALVSRRAENVLTVPVAALVVLPTGGYAVETVDRGTTRYATVRTGMFADGRVEISGDGVADGTVVVVPS